MNCLTTTFTWNSIRLNSQADEQGENEEYVEEEFHFGFFFPMNYLIEKMN